jgi:hypothetical protein
MKEISKELRAHGFKPVSEGLPKTGEPVFVFTGSYRCMAVLQKDGTWVSERTMKPLQENVIAWKAMND